MAAKKSQVPDDSAIKDPDNWTTGDEPMTGPQRSYLGTLAQEAGEPVEEELTKAEASKKIDELQEKTGRGASPGPEEGAREADEQAEHGQEVEAATGDQPGAPATGA